MIFQDPGGSLNPRLPIWVSVSEPLLIHQGIKKPRDLQQAAAAMLDRCGLPTNVLNRYPHEFSGGQKQRLAIARALINKPSLVICDEPTSALDVSVQAQILNLLTELQNELGVSYLFISHDLAVVGQMCDEIAVMQQGQIVEYRASQQVIHAPEHPYTKQLLASVLEVF